MAKESIEFLKDELKRLQVRFNETLAELKPKDSKLGGEIVSQDDYYNLKAVYNQYDRDEKGSFGLQELKNLIAALGEPLTDEEAIESMKELSGESDPSDGVTISFDQFVKWWVGQHVKMDKGQPATRTFKLVASQLLEGGEPFSCQNVMMQPIGTKFTLPYRLKFFYAEKKNLKEISPWHDIPLYAKGFGMNAEVLHFICEIPRYTRAKFEIATREPLNPMKQDVKNGRTRYYHHQSLFNYGLFPQTWEDPNHKIKFPSGNTYPGDNDPIDVLEIGYRQLNTGDVVRVKVLGILALIDDGETDWKIIAINEKDPIAARLNDIDDVKLEMPGVIEAIIYYFKNYKVLSGNEPNIFEFSEKCQSKTKALEIILETHNFWRELRKGQQEVAYTPSKPSIVSDVFDESNK